jgi:hypothetical protein
MRQFVRVVATCVFVQALAACSATDPRGDAENPHAIAVPQADGNAGDGALGALPKPQPSTEEGACATTRARASLVKHPVDIVLVVDNSPSMGEEAAAVERNINLNFADILRERGIDYRLVLVSRHRSDTPDSDAAICVEAPLSGLARCPAAAPVPSQHFFHYDTPVGSHDSLGVLVDTFATRVNSARDGETQANGAAGWGRWLRLGARKVFVEISDDDARMSALTFLYELRRVAPGLFGGGVTEPRFVFHSIVGVEHKAQAAEPYAPSEPIQMDMCMSDHNTVQAAGETYQELSRLSGGMRFPLCEFDDYDVVFGSIANNVVSRTPVACSFAIPAQPQGRAVAPDNILVSYRPRGGDATLELDQVTSPEMCLPQAFYVASAEIHLCGEACSLVQADDAAVVDVLFTCRSTLIR